MRVIKEDVNGGALTANSFIPGVLYQVTPDGDHSLTAYVLGVKPFATHRNGSAVIGVDVDSGGIWTVDSIGSYHVVPLPEAAINIRPEQG